MIVYREQGLRQAHPVQQLAVEMGFGVMLATFCGLALLVMPIVLKYFCFCPRISSSK